MTVNISRVGDNTRSILKEVEGDLKCTWEAEDLILVMDGSGNKLGVLSLKNGVGEESATFSGEITTDAMGATDINFLYLGSKTVEDLNALANPVVLDYAAQDGTLDWLSSNDFFSGSQTVDIANSYVSVESVSLLRQIAFGKFEMKLPDGVTYTGQPITVSGEGINTKASINMSDGEVTFSEAGNITVTRPEGTTSTEFFLTVLPSTITPTFSVAIDGKTYACSLAAREWSASEFVRKSGTFDGIALNMTEQTSGDNPYEGYENEDPRNPLHKFAKYNLVRVGERGSLVNDFASSETENGALYQWGRNYGYMDTNGIYNENIVSPDEDFTNYIDALGLFDDPDSEYDKVLDYYVYNPNSNRYFITSGTAKRYAPQHPQYSLWYDAPRSYSTVADLKAHPDKYFMDGTPGTKFLGYGSFYMGLDQFNNQPDYWLSSFGNGGSTWEARAEKCGYTTTNPCPDGWRMPTLEEFKAIAPEGQGLDKNMSMASMLSNYAEVRKTTDGVNYVIRWIYDSSAITVEAVVVDEAITKSQVTSQFWDNNRDKKVVRVFPFTGSIVPLVSYADDAEVNNVYIMRPYHRGFLDIGFIAQAYGPANNGTWTLIGPGNNAGAPFGGYWIDDKGYAFKFEAKEISHGTNTSNKTFTATSCMFVGSAEPVMGYAIRPVMAK